MQDLAYGPHERQKYDIYFPSEPNGDLYVIVHGGGWSKGDKAGSDIVPDKFSHWGPMGITVAAPNYRFTPSVTPAEQAQDIGRALSQMQARFGFKNIVLIGHSAGAHLALLLHTSEEIRISASAPNWQATIALDTSAVDLVAIMDKGPWHGWYEVFGKNSADWPDYSPLHQLNKSGPPILLICSMKRPAPCPSNEVFLKKATKLGQKTDLVPVELDHLPINADIGKDPNLTSLIDVWIEAQLPDRD